MYSRITGYYRPVQNWNAGKTQEFKARKVYSLENRNNSKDAAPATVIEDEESSISEYSVMLVTTEQCPNCDVVQSFMNDLKFQYDIVEVSKNPEVVSLYSVRSAPTLIVKNGTGYDTYANESNIRAFVSSQV